jgi:LacI family transcriptional regulator
MRIQSAEVARIAKVSRSTVSRVINNNPNVNEETRRKVLQVMKELNYTPNTNAQSLAGKKNNVIGLFIFEPKYRGLSDAGKLYFEYYMNFITSLTREAIHYNKQVLIDIIDGPEAEARLRSLFYNGNVSSGVFIGSVRQNPFIDAFIQHEFPVALIDYSTDKSLLRDHVSLINTDDLNGAYQITSDLIQEGCRRIVHVCGAQNKLSAIQRMNGYITCLQDHGINVQPSLILEGDYEEEKAYEIMRAFLNGDSSFDGIFAASDAMAHGVHRALREADIGDVPLWGFDNLRISQLLGIRSVEPGLSSTAVAAIRSLMNETQTKKDITYTKVQLIKTPEDYLKYYHANQGSLL